MSHNNIPSYDNRTSPNNLKLTRLISEKYFKDVEIHKVNIRKINRRRIERIINRQNEVNDIKIYDRKLQIKSQTEIGKSIDVYV